MSKSGTAPQRGDILTLAEAAEYLRIAEEKLADLAIDGGVPARRIGGEWRFLRQALDDWLRYSGRRDGSPPPRHWLIEAPFAEDLLAVLENRLLRKLGEKVPPEPGSKRAVLKHFGVFEGDDDLEDRLSDARARREAGG